MKVGSFTVVLILVFTYSISIHGQKSMETKTREVFINYPDSLVRINILKKPEKLNLKSDRIYFWYGSDLISYNRGGYSGNLLHGKYTQFDRKKRLRAEGQFELGLKSGLWKNWDEKGELISMIHWKNGFKEGKAFYYNEKGDIQIEGKYKDDKFDGWIIRYNGRVKERILYRNGTEVVPEAKKSKPTVEKKDSIISKKIKKNKNEKIDSVASKTNVFSKIFNRKSQKINLTSDDSTKNKSFKSDENNLKGPKSRRKNNAEEKSESKELDFSRQMKEKNDAKSKKQN